jgi:hypothetical protein
MATLLLGGLMHYRQREGGVKTSAELIVAASLPSCIGLLLVVNLLD